MVLIFLQLAREGLNIGGTKNPLFVIGTDVKENIIFVGHGDNHPGLFRKALTVSKKSIHWIREDLKIKEKDSFEFDARIRAATTNKMFFNNY